MGAVEFRNCITNFRYAFSKKVNNTLQVKESKLKVLFPHCLLKIRENRQPQGTVYSYSRVYTVSKEIDFPRYNK